MLTLCRLVGFTEDFRFKNPAEHQHDLLTEVFSQVISLNHLL